MEGDLKTEGKVKFAADNAFYNETEIFNRDMTVLALQAYLDLLPEKGFVNKNQACTVLDALSASGLRALRYKKEILTPISVTANDISLKAVEQIKENVTTNNVELEVSCADCNDLMRKEHFSVVDIDPYGSPGPFLAAAFQSIENNGLLMITATDSLITCGRQVDECIRRYQAVSINNGFCHELSVRIVLKLAAEEANRERCGFEVLCSFYMFHYLRVFLRVDKKHSRGIDMLSKCAEYAICSGCEWAHRGAALSALDSVEMPARCLYCQGKLKRVGPLWDGSLHSGAFIDQMKSLIKDKYAYLQQSSRIERFIEFQALEVEDMPLFLELSSLSRFFKVTTPPQVVFVNFLAQLGSRAAPTYFSGCGLRVSYNSYHHVLEVFDLWFRCQRLVGKAKAENRRELNIEPIGLESLEDLKWIIETQFGVDAEASAQFLRSEEAGTLVGGNICVSVDKKAPDVFEIAAKIGMFLSNPEKNWGPKKMK